MNNFIVTMTFVTNYVNVVKGILSANMHLLKRITRHVGYPVRHAENIPFLLLLRTFIGVGQLYTYRRKCDPNKHFVMPDTS